MNSKLVSRLLLITIVNVSTTRNAHDWVRLDFREVLQGILIVKDSKKQWEINISHVVVPAVVGRCSNVRTWRRFQMNDD